MSWQWNCWLLRCSWSIACRCCSNYIFILNLTRGFNGPMATARRDDNHSSFRIWCVLYQRFYSNCTRPGWEIIMIENENIFSCFIKLIHHNEGWLILLPSLQYVSVHLEFLQFILQKGVLYLSWHRARDLWDKLVANPDACEWDKEVGRWLVDQIHGLVQERRNSIANTLELHLSCSNLSMGKCKKDVTPLLTHWSYVFLALTHWNSL